MRGEKAVNCWYVLLVVGALGCGSSSGSRVEVSGRVTIDGKPLAEGAIVFTPAAGNQGPTAGARIQDGRYHIPRELGPVAGLNRVEVWGSRKTGRRFPDVRVPGRTVEERINLVPTRYGAESSLQHEVKRNKDAIDIELSFE